MLQLLQVDLCEPGFLVFKFLGRCSNIHTLLMLPLSCQFSPPARVVVALHSVPCELCSLAYMLELLGECAENNLG